MNKIIIKGRICQKPELKYTNSNIEVTDFSVAVNRRFDKEKTDFINCQAWRKTAEFINKYFDKGQEILVVGELHIEKYEKDGVEKTATRVVVEEVEFCGSKNQNQKEEQEESLPPADEKFELANNLSDLPF